MTTCLLSKFVWKGCGEELVHKASFMESIEKE